MTSAGHPELMERDRGFADRVEDDGFAAVDQVLDAELLAIARRRLDDIEAGRTNFPPDALTPERKSSETRKLKDLATNDLVFEEISRNSRILDLVETVLGPDLKLHASIGWMKPAFVGSQKSPHQDSAYWTHIQPPTFLVCWLAIDDATTSNGCLSFIPRSHRAGIVQHVMDGDLQVPDAAMRAMRDAPAVEVEVSAGGASFHYGTTIHWSGPNQSAFPRRAVSFAYMSSRCSLAQSWRGMVSFPVVRGRSFEGCV